MHGFEALILDVAYSANISLGRDAPRTTPTKPFSGIETCMCIYILTDRNPFSCAGDQKILVLATSSVDKKVKLWVAPPVLAS